MFSFIMNLAPQINHYGVLTACRMWFLVIQTYVEIDAGVYSTIFC